MREMFESVAPHFAWRCDRGPETFRSFGRVTRTRLAISRSLRTRTLIALGSVSLGLSFVLIWAAGRWIDSQFQALEQELAVAGAVRGRNAVESIGSVLSSTVADWGLWSDTKQFVLDENEAYESENLNATSLTRNAVDLVVMLRRDGSVLRLMRVDRAKEMLIEPEASLVGYDFAGLAQTMQSKQASGGCVRVADVGIISLALSDIRDPEDDEPSGTLVFGRLLDTSTQKELGAKIAMPLALDSTPLGGEFGHQVVDSEFVAGLFQIEDPLARPLATGRVLMPRDVTARGSAAISVLYAIVCGVALATVTVQFVLTDRWVVSRVGALSVEVNELTVTRDVTRRVHAKGRDEIGVLARGINEMLEALQGLTEHLRSATQLATEASRAKAAFIANVSHELRTPLNGIIGFADLLQAADDGTPQAEKLEWIGIVQGSAKHLLMLINDVLDMSKLEASAVRVERLPISPAAIGAEVIAMLRAEAEKKQLQLTLSTDPLTPQLIVADPTCVRQILTNLIGNAVKFTDSGHVKLAIAPSMIGEKQHIELRVSDTGVGIHENHIHRLFQPFSQADSTVTRRFGGTGLGLAISRGLAVAMGGDITVESVIGRGSTFTLMLPVELPLSQHAEPVASSSTPPPDAARQLTGRRVMVVDDTEVNRRLFDLQLRRAGAMVVTFGDAAQAVEAAAAHPVDVILMDLQMPQVDGIAAMQLLRARGVDAPTLALTAHDDPSWKRACAEAGFAGYLGKPIDPAILVRVVAAVCDGAASSSTHGVGLEDAASLFEERVVKPMDAVSTGSITRDELRRTALSVAEAAGALGVPSVAASARSLLDAVEAQSEGDIGPALDALRMRVSSASTAMRALTIDRAAAGTPDTH